MNFLKFFMGICFSFSLANAQENLPATNTSSTQKKLISFEGFVQFADGPSSVKGGAEQNQVQYGTPIYEDTKIKLEKSSSVKFVTRRNCVVVVYSEGFLIGPQAEKPWRINTEAARFICPTHNIEKFLFHGVEITPKGETLFDSKGKIFVITGSVQISQILLSRKIYQFTKGTTLIDPALQTLQVQYDFDNQYKIPREGEKLKKPATPAAPRPAPTLDKYRVSFGPLMGPSILLHANGNLNHYDYSIDGARLQFAFRENQPGYIIGLRYFETESKNHGYTNSPSTNDHLHTLGIDGGYRFDFLRWWSPFARVGVNWMQNELNISSNQNYNSESTYNYIGVSANFGFDFLFHPSWLGGLGLFASAEIELDQTLLPTKEHTDFIYANGTSPAEANNQKGFISNFSAMINLGIMYQF